MYLLRQKYFFFISLGERSACRSLGQGNTSVMYSVSIFYTRGIQFELLHKLSSTHESFICINILLKFPFDWSETI